MKDLVEVIAKALLDILGKEGCHHLGLCERGLITISRLDVERHYIAHPALTMDDVGHPTQLLNRLQDASGKEDRTFAIVVVILSLLVLLHQTLAEVIVVVDEIDLDLGRLDGGYLNDQRMVCIIDDEVHA